MRHNIKGQDIASTGDRIKEIRDYIHEDNEWRGGQKSIALHLRNNFEVVVKWSIFEDDVDDDAPDQEEGGHSHRNRFNHLIIRYKIK